MEGTTVPSVRRKWPASYFEQNSCGSAFLGPKFGTFSLAISRRPHKWIRTSQDFSHLYSMHVPSTRHSVRHGHVPHDAPAPRTPYMAMSVRANQAPIRYDVYAGCFAWLTLAGYVVLPTTFTSLQNAHGLDKTAGGKMVKDVSRNIRLLPLASILCSIGIAGTCWLWWKWRRNYIWLMSRIFL